MTNVINMVLKHETFGSGQLKAFLGSEIVVRFSHGDEKLPFPQAFEKDLKAVTEEDGKKIAEITERWNALCSSTSVRDANISNDPQTAKIREYDESRRKQKEEDEQLKEEKRQKKEMLKLEKEKSSAK